MWSLLRTQKWRLGTSEILLTPEIAVGIHFHARHCTNTTPVFLLADEEASWSLLPSSVSLLSGAAYCNQETPIPASSMWQVRSEKAKKGISINTNHSYHRRSWFMLILLIEIGGLSLEWIFLSLFCHYFCHFFNNET